MSITMNTFHLELDPTVLVALLTMVAHAVQTCLPRSRIATPCPCTSMTVPSGNPVRAPDQAEP